MVGHLEELVDYLRLIVEGVGDSKIKLSDSTIKLFEECMNIQEVNFKIFNKSIKGADTMSQLDLFMEHKNIRNRVKDNRNYFRGDEVNSYICSKLIGVVEVSHHINEELFR
jgi:hypothetical protein